MTSTRLRLAGLSIAALAATSGLALSQEGAPPPPPAASPSASAQPTPPYPEHIRPQAHYPQQRRSVVHHYPYPYPEYYHGEPTAGFRNPGGRGRYAEFYTGDEGSRPAVDPVRRAQFDQGGGAPDRAEQIAAYNAGTQRYNAIQQHIDNYARPYWGVGFGVGGFGGFW